ncbi:MAG: FIST C-terminal domain-containing protein [Clostridiales Family XIII bacterium]|jgi:hypothetical protein|nr:FIST C-terminal domain-containing protein [Clostridiales Family XIII bacterium]
MKMINVWTTEIDDADAAVSEILGKLGESPGANTVGLLGCHPDYIESGVAAAVAGRLPFDVIGCTTAFGSAAGAMDPDLLQIAVLAADDAEFAVAVSGPLTPENLKEEMEAVAAVGNGMASGKAKVGIIYQPMIKGLVGDMAMGALSGALGGTPLFGTLAGGIAMDGGDGAVIANGNATTGQIAVLFISGNVEPRFFMRSIANKNIISQKATVTESNGYAITKVNGMPYYDYLHSIGYNAQEAVDYTQLPCLFNFGSGRQAVALGIYGIDEAGGVRFGSKIPEGTTFSIGEIDAESIRETDENVLAAIASEGRPDCVLLFPCVSRYFMLAPDFDAEAHRIADALGGIPHAVSYSGGEICPVVNKDGTAENRFHNYSIVALAL